MRDRLRDRRGLKWGLTIVGIVVAAALVVGVVDWIRIGSVAGSVSGSAPGGTTYLLIGSDSRVGIPASQQADFGSAKQVPGERADLVLLLRVTDSGAVRVLGIPRDLILQAHGQGPARLAPMLLQGAGTVADALCNSLGIGIDHIIVFHFAGLESLVNLVGGIDISSDAVIADKGSGLLMNKGINHMDGQKALAYVRARHILVLSNGELVPDSVRSAQRPQRAINVMSAVGSKLDVHWWNPFGAERDVWTAAGAVDIDGNTGPFDLLHLESAARQVDPTEAVTLPVSVESTDPVPIDQVGAGARIAIQQFNGPGKQPKACSIPTMLTPAS